MASRTIHPRNSHSVMRDQPLTLLDIMERDIPHTEFGLLSACHTAVCDEKTPDEVTHLAVGLQFLGFKSVAGMLLEVDDAVAKHVVEAFYKYVFNPEVGVMECTKCALDCATHSVKYKSATRTEDGFHSYWCVVILCRIAFISQLSLPYLHRGEANRKITPSSYALPVSYRVIA
ncbi:uncharacterized protein HD556DRAFT_1346825 [Suillus plorans]|uniref:CHAT domain-containing protein n=1 Tax=Suillus plorans TaxID=116603 RepID=A0A9P7J2I2_9AGAM|nr:uncharacterized protein HD556DRAFT_1346825 [Suillus plorans]KAG1799307.1 hypothetical protein HD556DRAFT_1346825 [Suillus plorans]